MADSYSHRERIQAIIAGEKPDRFAASAWRHFYHMEHHAEGTVEAMHWFQKEFDWDFMKINPRANYHVQDWGLTIHYSHDEHSRHKYSDYPITGPEDWLNIKPLDPGANNLAEHLEVVTQLRKKSGKDLPILMTVFTPLAIAGRMVEDDQMLADHIRSHPDNIHSALRAITDTFRKYASELRNAGADGLFYATTQWGAGNLITWDEYKLFGIPYDKEVLAGAEGDAINLLHVCDSNNFLRELAEEDWYGCQLINWDASDPTNPPIDKTFDLLKGHAIVGGIDHKGWLLHSSPEEVGYKMDMLKDELDRSRVIIAPGCSLRDETNMETLRTIRKRLA